MSDPALVPHPSAVVRHLGEETVLVHLDTNRIFTLNPTGARIWELVVAGNPPARVEEIVAQEFDETPSDLRLQIADLVQDLRREKLLLDAPAEGT